MWYLRSHLGSKSRKPTRFRPELSDINTVWEDGGVICRIYSSWTRPVYSNALPMKLADVLLQITPYNPLPRYLTKYQPGVTPLSDTAPVIATLVTYLVIISSIRWFMQDRAALKLTSFFQSHNIFLAAMSGLLLVLIAEEILPIWWKTGFFSAICHRRSWTEVVCPCVTLSE